MSTGSHGEEDRILDESNALTAKGFWGLVTKAIGVMRGGWRAPKRHDHDAQDQAAADTDAAVNRALEAGRKKVGIG